MRDDSMLRRLPPKPSSSTTETPSITLHWYGQGYEQTISAMECDTVASALLLAGIRTSRNSGVSGEARLPFCMMGSCFECLVEVDGEIVQSCMTPAKHGMQVKIPEQV